MVGVRVTEDQQRYAGDIETVQTRPDGAGIRADIDDDGASGACGQDQAVTLPDIAGGQDPAVGRPAGKPQPHRDQHCGSADQHRRRETAHEGRSQQPDRRCDNRTGDQTATRTARHCHRRTGNRGEILGHRQQPPHRQRRAAQRELGQRHPCRCEHRTGRPDHRDRGDDRRDKNIRHDSDQADLSRQRHHYRRGHDERRRRDREYLGGQSPHALGLQPIRPTGCQQDQRARRQHREGEARRHRQLRPQREQPDHGGTQGGQGLPPPAGQQRQQCHRTHGRRPQDTRIRPGDDDEHHQRSCRDPGGHPWTEREQPGEKQHDSQQNREVRPADHCQVGEPCCFEVAANIIGQRRGVTHDECGQRPGGAGW